MLKNKRLNFLVTLGLIVVLCATSFGLVYGKTESELREEAKAAAENKKRESMAKITAERALFFM